MGDAAAEQQSRSSPRNTAGTASSKYLRMLARARRVTSDDTARFAMFCAVVMMGRHKRRLLQALT